MMHVSCFMYDRIMVRTRASMSLGWSPTGTFVMPGKSTNVMFNTLGEKIFNRICFSDIPLFVPNSRSVSNCRHNYHGNLSPRQDKLAKEFTKEKKVVTTLKTNARHNDTLEWPHCRGSNDLGGPEFNPKLVQTVM